uniref:Nucleolar protein 12 n=5 Tax=Boreoeutheria TaxID=1437010 RepID=A0A8C6RCB4_NANGA
MLAEREEALEEADEL